MARYKDDSRRYLYLIKEPFDLAKKIMLCIINLLSFVLAFYFFDDVRFLITAILSTILVWVISEWIYGTYKIGITANLKSRLSAINNGNARNVFYVYTKRINKAGVVETKIHKRYKSTRKGGEWFGLWFWQVFYLKLRYFL